MDKLSSLFPTHAVYSAKCDGNKLAEISNKQAFRCRVSLLSYFLNILFRIQIISIYLLDNNLLCRRGGINADINGRSQLAALGDGFVHRVLQEVLDTVLVHGLAIVNGSVSKLIEDVIETGSPLPGAGLGSEGAVVNHESNATVVHVWAERVDGLNDGLVDNLRVGVAGLAEDIDLGHHGGNVNTGREGVQGDVIVVASGADALTDLPGVSSINLADGVLVETITVHDDGADLVTRGNLIINLLQNLLGRHVRSRVGLLEDLLIIVIESLVDSLDADLGDGLDDVAGDGLAGLLEGLLGGHALALVAAGERLNDAVDGAEEDATLAVDVGLVLRGEGGLEHEGRSKSDTPAKSEVGGLAGLVLVDGEGGVDASAVDLLTLLVETTDRGAHTLGADGNDVHVLGEGFADGIEVAEEEAVGKAEGGTRLHGGEDLLVKLGLGSIRDEEDDEIGILDNIVELTEGAVLLTEANVLGLLVGGRAGTKTDGDLDIGASLVERVAKVLGLSRGLGSPADDTDLLDPLEGRGEEGEEIASALDDGFGGIGELDLLRGEDVRGKAAIRAKRK